MDQALHNHPADGPCVRRDKSGTLRAACGTGLLIASPWTTREQIEDWASTTHGESRANYAAALAFIDAEGDWPVARPKYPALPVGLRARSAHQSLVALRARFVEAAPDLDVLTELDTIIAELAD